MALKLTELGLLIYLTMAAYVVAFILTLAGERKSGHIVFIVGFAIAVAALTYRTVEAQHPPLKNMFEVFLCLSSVIYPLSIFCKKFLKIDNILPIGAAIGAIMLVPAGFVKSFSPDKQMLMPALQSPLFIPHVSAYMLAYVVLFMAAAMAGIHLVAMIRDSGDTNPKTRKQLADYELWTYKLVKFGFPLLTVGLILGAVWGKLAWGDWWNWDPKELWSLVSFLVFLGYLHVRYMFGIKLPAINSVLVLLGAVAIILTLLWVNLSKLFPGMHSYATGG